MQYRGNLFRNDFKDWNDPNNKQPHYRGSIEINGIDMEMAGWINATQKDANGDVVKKGFLGITIKEKTSAVSPQYKTTETTASVADDEIPF
jgi:hypothetical protein